MIYYCRCVFASNFPVDRVNGTFPQLMSALEAILQPYSLEDKKKFFAENARKFYRLWYWITTKRPRVYNVKPNFVQDVIQDFTGL